MDVPPRGTRARSPTRSGPERKRLCFDHCLPPSATQRDVFAAVDMPAMLAHALQGFPVMVFAFGQTGAGKTHTILGGCGAQANQLSSEVSGSTAATAAADASAGLLPAALRHAFQLLPCVQDRTFEVSVSVVEVYNERASDLLAGGRSALVRQHPQRGFYVEGLHQVACRSADAAEGVLKRALIHRCSCCSSLKNVACIWLAQ